MITIDEKSLKRAEALFKSFPNALPKAISRAMNRAVQSARTAGVKQVRSEYIVKAKDVNGTIKVTKASPSSLVSKITSRGRSKPLIEFKVSPNKAPSGKPKRPVTVKVKKSGGGIIEGAFLARGKKGVSVFRRISKSAYPIKQLQGPSVPQMLGNKKVIKVMEKRGAEQLQTRFEHEVDATLGGVLK
ncbi:phage tail protein [Selenomonadales bacterium OttesenSCG-928-I06]|nr:phage tail protein [Selenomonadales bacterium OttesenSCG-928-I06]